MKILMVLTSHDQLGSTGRKTGFWLEEFAAPYFVFRDAGVDLTLASPKGGQPPVVFPSLLMVAFIVVCLTARLCSYERDR